jgi:serine/threonine protein kinase
MLLAGQYRIGRVLGSGGFGITYLALDERLDKTVAVKEFFPRDLAGRSRDGATLVPHTRAEGAAFDKGRTRFLEEAQVLARFDHANIVRVRSFFEANGTGYLVMDYYEGCTLEAYLREQPGERIPERLAVQILMHVLDALRAVHGAGLLHRDIKPQNIYVTQDRRILLLDFGTAREAAGEHSRSEIVTGGYAPWEQYSRRGKQGPWTDVYASAATLYRMVTGERPPDAPDRIHEDTLRPAHEREPSVSERLSQVLQRGLALRPAERPQSAEAFQQSLAAGNKGDGQNEVLGDNTYVGFWTRTGSATRTWIVGSLVFILYAVTVVVGGRNNPEESPSLPDRPAAGQSPGLSPDTDTTALQEPAWDIPSLRATVEGVRFFEGGDDIPPPDQRRYATTFNRRTTRSINVELRLSHPEADGSETARVTCTYYRSDGIVLGKPADEVRPTPGTEATYWGFWWGWEEPGNWAPGTYRVECSAEGRVIAEKTFKIDWDIPSLRATVDSVWIFESGAGETPPDQRRYATTFARPSARYIFVELRLSYPAPGRRVSVPVTCTYYRSDNSVLGEIPRHQIRPEPDWDGQYWSTGWGYQDPGNWAPGTYRVECSAEGRVIAKKTFKIRSGE